MLRTGLVEEMRRKSKSHSGIALSPYYGPTCDKMALKCLLTYLIS